ncbi:MAG TPA: pirin family protein [Symbiobacteriaceae bacterium]
MIKIIRSHERFHADAGWLSANWHFSFDYYHDPENMSFGPLRVFNDDTIAPRSGFGMHPHREMEIVTYVISGELEHQDSTGNRGVLRAGDLQRMSAGTGIRHSEVNPSATEPLRLCQIWILPAVPGLPPSYEERHFDRAERLGRLLPVVSPGTAEPGAAEPGTMRLHQDTTFYVCSLDSGAQVEHRAQNGRRAYLFVISGEVTLNGETLAGGDQARITGVPDLAIQAREPAELILIDLP